LSEHVCQELSAHRIKRLRERKGLDRSAENKFERAPVNYVRDVIIAR